MSQTLQTPMDSSLIAKINDMIYERDGQKYINLGNCRLDFKKTFAFLGFTKNMKKVILGDIHSSGPDGIKYTRRYGTIEVSENGMVEDNKVVDCRVYSLVTDGWSYSETLKKEKI
jgi:hypothetical protein